MMRPVLVAVGVLGLAVAAEAHDLHRRGVADVFGGPRRAQAAVQNRIERSTPTRAGRWNSRSGQG